MVDSLESLYETLENNYIHPEENKIKGFHHKTLAKLWQNDGQASFVSKHNIQKT